MPAVPYTWATYNILLHKVVEKKKELASKCSTLEEDVRIGGGIKQEAHRLEQRCQQLQASNTALKRQLTALQQQHTESKATNEQVSLTGLDVGSSDMHEALGC